MFFIVVILRIPGHIKYSRLYHPKFKSIQKKKKKKKKKDKMDQGIKDPYLLLTTKMTKYHI